MPKFTMGYTLADNTPCVLIHGDSVFATFPSMPYGEQQAKEMCAMLNMLSTIAAPDNAFPHIFN